MSHFIRATQLSTRAFDCTYFYKLMCYFTIRFSYLGELIYDPMFTF